MRGVLCMLCYVLVAECTLRHCLPCRCGLLQAAWHRGGRVRCPGGAGSAEIGGWEADQSRGKRS